MINIMAYLIAGIILIYNCVCLFLAGNSWHAATRLYGKIPFNIAARTTLSMFSSRNRWYGLLPVASLLTIGILWWQTELGWFLFLPLAVGALVILLDAAEPPSILFLGSSQWSTIRFTMRLQRGIHPYRVIFLLNPESANHLRPSWLARWKWGIDNVRILGGHDWRQTVFVFLSRVPLVVLDTRIPSPAVVEEICHVLKQGLRHKVIFVVNDDGSSPVLDSLAEAEDRSKLAIVNEMGVLDKLRQCGCTRTQSPYDAPLAPVVGGRSIASRMQQVGKTVPRLAEAIRRAQAIHGETLFVREALLLHERLIGPPGARLEQAPEQALADLDSDHAAAASFVQRWSSAEKITENAYHEVVIEVIRMCLVLSDLQIAVDAAPADFLIRMRKAAKLG